jgi:hypothetical protein
MNLRILLLLVNRPTEDTCGQILEPLVKILSRLQARAGHRQCAHWLLVHNHFPSIRNDAASVGDGSKRDARRAVGLNLSELVRSNLVNGHAIGDSVFAAAAANNIAKLDPRIFPGRLGSAECGMKNGEWGMGA